MGENSIAIGAFAASTDASKNSITLNGTGEALVNGIEDAFIVKPVRNAAGPNALTYNPTTGEISYTTSSSQTKENIVDMSRDACGILCDLDVKEYNYVNKCKYIEHGTPEEAKPFANWLAAEKAADAWTSRLAASGGSDAKYEGGADDDNPSIRQMYRDYVEITEVVPYTFVDKEETHFGFMAEDVQKVLPELVYCDLDGTALDIKWNNITALLVKENQSLRAEQAAAQTTIADLVARVEALEGK
ncbi:hypothetical protein SARC_12744 [Sphaeroforma arctica JP610]|uniref:Peptidase S74 domain-containing protein n=1 Tax=Sphaeroforma arctica JP610 TaxID=667725 RepID=A0A0L0FD98_9EUKA|nr:hypothetical protein SARC_12744 [Sphaeroforma arctica JP610]KNC74715.1 hypothetical protein SARC_12744 [Sphaeroforma arctica JP610]|eukprot:XP_014148617.1 hypothetical protein SARC_12744 [Sphaeroforma arctica JP610]